MSAHEEDFTAPSPRGELVGGKGADRTGLSYAEKSIWATKNQTCFATKATTANRVRANAAPMLNGSNVTRI
ncbi:hypothetical protein Q7F05_04460 [Pseudomonas sp. Lb2C1-1]|uniref:hypothetical protein n=1 Tax=Pseudomonas TaxID=286 RepID=UPI00128C08E4|nr:hypothetical protein [Pseudomonas ogarae]